MRPLIVLVGGAPGSGKTTLALELARRQLGRVSYEVMRVIAERTVAAGGSLILEAKTSTGTARRAGCMSSRAADGRFVLCRTSVALSRERFVARGAAGLRHPVNLDREILEQDWGRRGVRGVRPVN